MSDYMTSIEITTYINVWFLSNRTKTLATVGS